MGGREWPHRIDWAPEAGGDDQGGDEAVIGEPSEVGGGVMAACAVVTQR